MRCAAISAILFCGVGSALAQEKLPTPQQLNKGLVGLRVISVEPELVRYLPRQVIHVDREGSPLPTFATLQDLGNGKVLAQSTLSIQAEEDEAKLLKIAQEKVGKEVEVKAIVTQKFRLRLLLDGKEVFVRPLAGGSYGQIQVTAEVAKPGDKALWEAEVEMEWSEVVTPVQLKMEIQWEKLAAELTKEAKNDKGEFTRKIWLAGVEQGLAKGLITITPPLEAGQTVALEKTVLAIEGKVLEPAGFEGNVERYRLRTEATKSTETYEFKGSERVVLRTQFRRTLAK